MSIYKLQNKIQNYAWGSEDFIPSLLGLPVKTGLPNAELWMGAHPKAPSQIPSENCSLLELIERNTIEILGEKNSFDFNQNLPFLLKILSASKPLSIQAHPDLEQAKKGFHTENEMVIPLSAYNRNYKDDNHKPELICALTPFTAMCGFRVPVKIKELLNDFGMHSVLPDYNDIDITEAHFKQFFYDLMHSDKIITGGRVNVLLENLKNVTINSKNKLIIEWIQKLNEYYPGDVGVFSPILLNLIELLPGQAIFLEAGVPHAYLLGSGIEIMANSDNVLRGGLTPKHVNVPELLKTLTFAGGEINIIDPLLDAKNEKRYETQANEFELTFIELSEEHSYRAKSAGPEILLCTDGECKISYGSLNMVISKGESIFISAKCSEYSLAGCANLYKAKIPEN
jgi:mannose-6-phosphate isomerase